MGFQAFTRDYDGDLMTMDMRHDRASSLYHPSYQPRYNAMNSKSVKSKADGELRTLLRYYQHGKRRGQVGAEE